MCAPRFCSVNDPINFTGPLPYPRGNFTIGDLSNSVKNQIQAYKFPLTLEPLSFTEQLLTDETNVRLIITFASIGFPIFYGVLVGFILNKEED